MQLNPSEISELIKSKIQNLDTGSETRTQGTVVSVTDGICRIHGIAGVPDARTPMSAGVWRCVFHDWDGCRDVACRSCHPH